jgi:hypothetical protein
MIHTSIKSERFTVECRAMPDGANDEFWVFLYDVSDSQERKHTYKCQIRKSYIADPAEAETFAKGGQALDSLYALLNEVTDGQYRKVEPELNAAWWIA